jgi:hypothetical protein
MAYGLGMPAEKRATPQDTVTASQILLDGLAHDAGVSELLNQLAPLHPRDNTFPGEVFLRMAADALDRFEASRADPVILEGMRERFHRVANPGEYAPGRRTRPRRVLATRLFDEQDG